MSVFKSPNRKIFLKKRDIKSMVDSASDLIEIVEGVRSDRWISSETGMRLKDTKEWCRFFVVMNKFLPCLLLAFLVGCSVTPVTKSGPPVPIRKSMVSPPEDKLVTFFWNHPDQTNVDFYALYYGPNSRAYTNKWIALGTNLTTTVTLKTAMYYTVTANKTNGLESDFSNELIYPRHLEPRTNVVVVTMWSTNGTDWIDLKRETNAVSGSMGLWKLRVE